MVFPFEKFLIFDLKTHGLIYLYLNITKIFDLINIKNLRGQLYDTTVPDVWKNDPVNHIENVLIDFLENVVAIVPFSVSTNAVPYL